MGELKRPETWDKRPGMGRPDEMWRYRLGQRVKGIRLLQDGGQGWTQDHFAKVCRIAKSTVTKIEMGQGTTTVVIVKISQTFGVSMDWLVGLDRVPKQPHEIVDEAYEAVCSLASSLDYSVENPKEISVRHLSDTADMIARSRRHLVDLCFRLRHPDPANPKTRIPYGYEFVQGINERLGYDIDV